MRLRYRKNLQFGNRKLPKSTAIFNICSAHDCPSRTRGLCQVINAGHRCYALRDEQFYPGPLSFRRNQERVWDTLSAEEFVGDFLTIVGHRRTPTTALRLNESGDFRSQSDVDKAAEIARLLRPHGVTVYCYTARRDLDFSAASPMVVNGSGFKVHGEFRFVRSKTDRPKGYGLCPGSCAECGRCLRGELTCVLPH
jgi:hypothetical protein